MKKKSLAYQQLGQTQVVYLNLIKKLYPLDKKNHRVEVRKKLLKNAYVSEHSINW